MTLTNFKKMVEKPLLKQLKDLQKKGIIYTDLTNLKYDKKNKEYKLVKPKVHYHIIKRKDFNKYIDAEEMNYFFKYLSEYRDEMEEYEIIYYVLGQTEERNMLKKYYPYYGKIKDIKDFIKKYKKWNKTFVNSYYPMQLYIELRYKIKNKEIRDYIDNKIKILNNKIKKNDTKYISLFNKNKKTMIGNFKVCR
jgi:hypothetical protein